MLRIISVLAVAAVAALMAAMIAVAALPAFAQGKNPPTSCGAGDAVSSSVTQFGGLGKRAEALSLNPGEAIQNFKGLLVDPVCHLDDPGQTP